MGYRILYSIMFFFFLFINLAPSGIRSFASTGGAQALGKEFFASAFQLIQRVNLQSDGPKKQFALSGFQI